MDGIGEDLLDLLGHSLLEGLGYLAVACSVTLAAGGASIVDGVGNVLLDASGELILGGLRDLRAADCVGSVCA